MGPHISLEKTLEQYRQLLASRKLTTVAPLLPLLFNIRGQPLSLQNHPPFEEFFSTQIPLRVTFKTARQVGKSTMLSIKSLLLAVTQPYFTILHVAPLYEQARRFSTIYVAPRIQESPIRALFTGARTVSSVLHRSFTNNSQILFSYCYLNCDRILGISAHMVSCDEVQDLDPAHLPLIMETMAWTPEWGISMYAGVPRTLDNTVNLLWEDSSQAEWFVPCLHCTTNGAPTWNIPSIDHHLDQMIGPWHPHISEEYPGTICHKCRNPISPRLGRWVHRYPERQKTHAGFHIPQVIMPFHYAYPHKWLELLEKRQGLHNTSPAAFHNEVLGESYERAARLIGESDLLAVATLGPNTPENANSRKKSYTMTAMGVDWGGGGVAETSFTVLALVGLLPDGTLEVPWATRLYTPHDHIREARETLAFWRFFSPDILAHDYIGAGSLRETLLVQAGLPLSRIMPIAYTRSPAGAVCRRVPESRIRPREHYQADRTRTLLLLCGLIRLGHIRFFNYTTEGGPKNLLTDFLSLAEDKVRFGGDHEIYRIVKGKGQTDDLAHAVNYGCIALFSHTRWPDLLRQTSGRLQRKTLELIDPSDPAWDTDL